MAGLDRRAFLKTSMLPAAALPVLAAVKPRFAEASEQDADVPQSSAVPGIIDTNVNLFDWPFRRLKYSDTAGLLTKLRSHRVKQAWVGSFEALLHKNIDAVNARLAHECRQHGEGRLVPFGTVNPAWPDWREDLRRCDEVYAMPGVRIYPAYQNYTLEHAEFARLLEAVAERGMLLQIALDMEDSRVHHPLTHVEPADPMPLLDLLQELPRARVQLLNWARRLRGDRLPQMVERTQVTFDISHLEGVGAVGRMIEGEHWYMSGRVPAERLLFGSHAPYFPCENALLKLFESPLERDQLERIMHVNAERLMQASG